MANFPFFRPYYPNYYYRYYPHYDSSNIDKNDSKLTENLQQSDKENTKRNIESKKKSSKYNSFGPIHFSNSFFDNLEEPVLEILGIKLYLDDIIILGLLFFLYQENVQDELLFLSLILLLLT